MTDTYLCNWPGCNAVAGPANFIFGKAYCPEHYPLALRAAFLDEYHRWDGKTKPSDKFMNLFSRYAESVYPEGMPSGLSKGRLNHRVYEIEKTPTGLSFYIERHPFAWSDPKRMTFVEQRWNFNVETGKLKLEGENERG